MEEDYLEKKKSAEKELLMKGVFRFLYKVIYMFLRFIDIETSQHG